MKSDSATRRAVGLGTSEKLKAETLKAEIKTQSVPQPDGEELFLDQLMQFMRSAKRCQVPDVASAAREWERVIDYRIKVTMQERKRRDAARGRRAEDGGQRSEDRGRNGQRPSVVKVVVSTSPQSGKTNVTSSQSVLHIRLGVSPNQG
jgi:hypothetical protein